MIEDITVKKRVAKTFYEKRKLPRPRREFWPSDAGALSALIRASEPDDPPLLLLGDGQHLRDAVLGERTFDVVRTESCSRIVSVDRESKLVRAECGIRWGELKEELESRGLSLERYGLYPATATLGGLLSRYRPVHREMWDHSIRTGCVAISAVSPARGEYEYLAAPRKASGPDLRHLYIGAEGLVGAILDATLVAWTPGDARLYTFKDVALEDVARIYSSVYDLGVAITWAHFRSGVLHLAIHGPTRLLNGVDREMSDRLTEIFEVGDRDAVEELRTELEVGHPERRSLASARRAITVQVALGDLGAAAKSFDPISETIEIWDLTRHRATIYVRFAHDEFPSDIPHAASAVALCWRPVVDDETVHWPHWAQTLKTQLDPERRLSSGP